MGRQQGKASGRRPTVEATVGYVRALSGTTEAASQGWVDCPREEGSVSVDRCISCHQCASMTFTRDGRIESMHCYRPKPGQEPLPHQHGLLADVPSVGDLMTRDVVAVQPDLSVDALMSLLTDQGFKAVPVVKADGTVVGVVSESDVLAYVHARGDTSERDWNPPPGNLPRSGMHEVEGLPVVQEVMMPLVLAIPETAPVTQAAALMAFEGVHRVIVRNDEGKIVGLLSASDVLGWLGRVAGFGGG